MPWYPRARKHDVKRDRNTYDRHMPVRINHHTAVTNAQHLDGQAANKSQAYPHFMIGRDGQVVQYQDTSYIARADLEGNRAGTISIETWDGYPNGAPGYWKHNGDVPPWTDKQVEAIVALDRWLIEQHPSIPTRLAKDSRPGSSSHGLSWHRLGCDGNFPDEWPFWGRRSGGMKYSNARGKQCPGDRRITQVVEVIFPALNHGVAGITIPPTVQEDDVTTEAQMSEINRWIENIHKDIKDTLPGLVADAVWTFVTSSESRSGWTMLRRATDAAQATNAALPAIAGRVGASIDTDALAAGLAGPLTEALAGSVSGEVVESALRRVFADAATPTQEA